MPIRREYIQRNRSLWSALREVLQDEFEEYLDYITLPNYRPYIRANTLRVSPERLRERLENRGFVLEDTVLPYAFRVLHYPSEMGKTLEHFLGYYYVQDLASMLPAHLLNPAPHSYVLDIAAAPGSKTTLLSALMKNTGMVFANDASTDRVRALVNNVERMGCLNVVVSISKGERLARFYREFYDYVLVDVPCSSAGTLHKNPEVALWWSPKDVKAYTRVQYRLLLAGWEMLKPGGRLIYSTCTVTYEENENVVERFITHSGATLEPIPSLGIGEIEGAIHGTKRFYPHRTHTEGFFIAAFRK
ncbi:MAG: RsmB/NOP family class I SAM-dependent RNA methyltransferase [Thermotogae bacterium]|nr:RsmB/NOP family class I SAM-dependent RNA methyltransferase [Thermotogota bacterium]